MERLTYRNNYGGKAYLLQGLDAVWSKMPQYDVLNNGIQKLARYEETEEQCIKECGCGQALDWSE